MTTRHTRTRTLTIPDDVYAKLEALAAEDAARVGANPDRQRSATVCALVIAEHDRRHAVAVSRATYPGMPRRGAAPPLPATPGDGDAADVATALREALARLTASAQRGPYRLASLLAQNLVDEAGLVGDTAWREATRVLHDAGWRQGPDDGDAWTAPASP